MTHTIVYKGWANEHKTVKLARVRPKNHTEDCGHDITVTWMRDAYSPVFHGPMLAWGASVSLSARGSLEVADAIRFCTELKEPEL